MKISNTISLWKLIVSLSICFTLFTKSSKAADAPEAFLTQLTLSRRTISLYEVVMASVTLKNNSRQTETLTSRFWWEPILTVSYGEKPLSGGGMLSFISLPPSPVQRVFKPGESITKLVVIGIEYKGYGEQRSFEAVFAQPGIYSIYAEFAGIKSPIKRLNVTKATIGDQAALDYLVQHKLYRFFSKDIFFRDYAEAYDRDEGLQQKLRISDETEKLLNLIKLYPKSRYAHWARLGLYYIREVPLLYPHFARENTPPDIIVALHDLQREIEATASTLYSPAKALAWYEAGVVASFLKNSSVAETNFKKAIEAGDDATMVDRIEMFKQLLQAYQPAPIPLVPKSIFDEAVRELESKRYDVDSFARKFPKEYKLLLLATLKLREQQRLGNITEEEYYRRSGKLLQEYVTKYSNPLSEEEWRRLHVQIPAPAQPQ